MTQIEPTPPINGTMSTLKVRTPLSRRVRSFCRKFVPITIWICAILLLLPLVKKQSKQIHAIGFAERYNSSVRPLIDGRISHLKVDIFQKVQAGDEIALLDDMEYQALTKVTLAEIDEMRSDLVSTSESIKMEYNKLVLETNRDYFNDTQRLELNEEEARLDLFDREVAQNADIVALTRLITLVKYQKNMLDRNVGVRQEYDDLKLEKEALEKKIEGNISAITYARNRVAEAKRRREAQVLTSVPLPETSGLTLLRNAVNELEEARLQELERMREGLILRAPITGTVSEILTHEGEIVTQGSELLIINSDITSRVIGYIDESMVANVREGMPVKLFSRRYPHKFVESQVVAIGTKIDKFPLRLRPNIDLPQYGLAILINLPENTTDIFPGELLDIQFPK